MNISREEIGTLNEVLKIKLIPEDYLPKFETELKKFQKTMNLPGFRPGHVPVGLIKKKYGKAILIDELNKMVSGTLENYINEQKLDILGSPIPQPSDDLINNWDEPGNFEFNFEIGLAPEISLTLPPSKTFDQYEIIVDDEKVNQYVDDIRRKYGKFSNPETSDADTIFYGDFAELDAEGNAKAEGIISRSTLSVASLKDATIQKEFIGRKKGDVVKINLVKAFNGDMDEIAHMLNQPVEKIQNNTSDFNFTIDTVNQVELADMNQEFFDKIYGAGLVSSVDEFRERVRTEIAGVYVQDTDMKLKHDVEDHLLDEMGLQLPDNFLRKWLQTAVEQPMTEEQVEKEYNGYSRGMKLRLIENRVFRDQNMQISQDEIRDMARQYIMHQFSGYASALTDDIMDSLIKRYLEKRESVERIIETLSDRKVFNYLKSVIKTNTNKVTYDEFLKIAKNHQHKH
ncbi:MAG: trigger factor [Bacteroidetes bacterium]|nr:trigger factor [Bacteroidota bacterium]